MDMLYSRRKRDIQHASESTNQPYFKTPAGQFFGGKPAKDKYNEFGLLCLCAVPTHLDKTWAFSDQPLLDEEQFMGWISGTKDIRPKQVRFEQSVYGVKVPLSIDPIATEDVDIDILRRDMSERDYSDSVEIGIECFKNPNAWPDHTDLKCWWCLHGFDSKPFPCPVRRDSEMRYHTRGVFCSPSCAKAWALHDVKFADPHRICMFIDNLAKSRGYRLLRTPFDDYGDMGLETDGIHPVSTADTTIPSVYHVHIPVAPPRETLQMFRGKDGLTIEQFRTVSKLGFDVQILSPPCITQKQIILGECEKLLTMYRKGIVCHKDDPNALNMSAMAFARQRKQGLKVFAGLGAKRLADYLEAKPPTPQQRPISNYGPSKITHIDPVSTGQISSVYASVRKTQVHRGVRKDTATTLKPAKNVRK